MKHAREEFKKKKMDNFIPRSHHPGVPNTTFATQPLDCGVNKSFKCIYRKKA